MVGPHPDIRSDADIQWRFRRKWTSAPAPASGYPSAAAGIRGYPPSKEGRRRTGWKDFLPAGNLYYNLPR
ncbi:hypothetical protein PGTUg99_022661 [Puccinia graminis f. sp. tritici]|uniref:Uncharacterized protein n=1 Tax=Puccinia graminis f. sp. tritici TaxID=56615 RepID=A0A5B0Q3B3_PUCGR|nr:hypothetical protein PGTUg99_022661 [Puccinia graminis f. sp. tritici]